MLVTDGLREIETDPHLKLAAILEDAEKRIHSVGEKLVYGPLMKTRRHKREIIILGAAVILRPEASIS